jgi:hypothetical protein
VRDTDRAAERETDRDGERDTDREGERDTDRDGERDTDRGVLLTDRVPDTRPEERVAPRRCAKAKSAVRSRARGMTIQGTVLLMVAVPNVTGWVILATPIPPHSTPKSLLGKTLRDLRVLRTMPQPSHVPLAAQLAGERQR